VYFFPWRRKIRLALTTMTPCPWVLLHIANSVGNWQLWGKIDNLLAWIRTWLPAPSTDWTGSLCMCLALNTHEESFFPPFCLSFRFRGRKLGTCLWTFLLVHHARPTPSQFFESTNSRPKWSINIIHPCAILLHMLCFTSAAAYIQKKNIGGPHTRA
jgi:hypothetical protein